MGSSHQRKKAPELIRQRILDSAMTLAAQEGVTSVTIQAVANLVGITKGGVLHHFPSKKKLLDAMVISLLERLDVAIDQLIEQDPQPYGCFTRAYIEVTLEKTVHGLENSWTAISMTMLTDRTFNQYWIQWLNTRIKQHHSTDGDLALKILRYAADGVWLTIFSKIEDEQQTKLLKKALIARSYQTKSEH